jgi:hypothetical protein
VGLVMSPHSSRTDSSAGRQPSCQVTTRLATVAAGRKLLGDPGARPLAPRVERQGVDRPGTIRRQRQSAASAAGRAWRSVSSWACPLSWVVCCSCRCRPLRGVSPPEGMADTEGVMIRPQQTGQAPREEFDQAEAWAWHSTSDSRSSASQDVREALPWKSSHLTKECPWAVTTFRSSPVPRLTGYRKRERLRVAVRPGDSRVSVERVDLLVGPDGLLSYLTPPPFPGRRQLIDLSIRSG